MPPTRRHLYESDNPARAPRPDAAGAGESRRGLASPAAASRVREPSTTASHPTPRCPPGRWPNRCTCSGARRRQGRFPVDEVHRLADRVDDVRRIRHVVAVEDPGAEQVVLVVADASHPVVARLVQDVVVEFTLIRGAEAEHRLTGGREGQADNLFVAGGKAREFPRRQHLAGPFLNEVVEEVRFRVDAGEKEGDQQKVRAHRRFASCVGACSERAQSGPRLANPQRRRAPDTVRQRNSLRDCDLLSRASAAIPAPANRGSPRAAPSDGSWRRGPPPASRATRASFRERPLPEGRRQGRPRTPTVKAAATPSMIRLGLRWSNWKANANANARPGGNADSSRATLTPESSRIAATTSDPRTQKTSVATAADTFLFACER